MSRDELLPEEVDEAGNPQGEKRAPLKRVPVVVRSWDGPNSRLGLELDLTEVPWGPFDALGKRLSLLLPFTSDGRTTVSPSESQVERALRHVEHASDRCGEFAQIANGNQELWLRSQETWEWIRRYLTDLWVETELQGGASPAPQARRAKTSQDAGSEGPDNSHLPSLPHAAATLRVAAKALRATPLSTWRESTGATDLETPTREEAVQTLLGVARILSGETPKPEEPEATQVPENAVAAPGNLPAEAEPALGGTEPASSGSEADLADSSDPDQVSFHFAQGYDEGYQMGRRVGLALGRQKSSK